MTNNYVTLRGSIDKVNKDDSYKIELINARDRAELAAKNAKVSEGNAENSAQSSADSAEKATQASEDAAKSAEKAALEKQDAVKAKDAASESNLAAQEANRYAQKAAEQASQILDNTQRCYEQTVAAANNAMASKSSAQTSAENALNSADIASKASNDAANSNTAAEQAKLIAEDAKSKAETAQRAAELAEANAHSYELKSLEAKAASENSAVEAKKYAEASAASAEKAEEAAQGIAADREQIGANTAGLEAAQQDVTALKAENTALKAETARTARSLDYLWKKSKGIVYDTETVTGAGSSVTVPSGAMEYAALRMVGGKTVRWNQLLDALPNPGTYKGVKVAVSNWKVSLSGTATDNMLVGVGYAAVTVPGHKYMATGLKGGSRSTFYVQGVNENNGYYNILDTTAIFAATGTKYRYNIIAVAGTVFDHTFQPMVIDLTVMFGSGNAPTDTTDPRIAQIDAYAAAHPEYNAGELVSALVDAVRVANVAGDNTNTYPIPQTIRDLCPDYGIGVSADCYNYIDFAAKQYHHRVGQVDLWTLTWIMQKSQLYKSNYFASQSIVSTPHAAAFLTADYTSLKSAEVLNVDMSCWVSYGCGADGRVIIRDDRYNDAASFKSAMTGKILYVELATPEIIDLSAVWPDDDFGVLRVEAGGTISLHYPALDDGYELAVPSETEIMVAVAKVVETDG